MSDVAKALSKLGIPAAAVSKAGVTPDTSPIEKEEVKEEVVTKSDKTLSDVLGESKELPEMEQVAQNLQEKSGESSERKKALIEKFTGRINESMIGAIMGRGIGR